LRGIDATPLTYQKRQNRLITDTRAWLLEIPFRRTGRQAVGGRRERLREPEEHPYDRRLLQRPGSANMPATFFRPHDATSRVSGAASDSGVHTATVQVQLGPPLHPASATTPFSYPHKGLRCPEQEREVGRLRYAKAQMGPHIARMLHDTPTQQGG